MELKKVSENDVDFLYQMLKERDSVENYLHKELPTYDTDYPKGPIGAVTYFPAGIDDPNKPPAGTNIFKDLRGSSAYKEWSKNVNRILKGSG